MSAPRPVTVVNYGGGVNSTALCCLAVQRGLPIDVVVFADTGSERPETYAYLATFSAYLQAHGLPALDIVRWIRVQGEKRGQFIPLHTWCETEQSVPSRAYGFSGCTSKWKQQPADKFVRAHPLVAAAHARGEVVERWIGFDADEPHRAERMLAKNPDPTLWRWRAPLVEWGLGRADCLAAIAAAGLPSPGKSACWMCPSSKKSDIDTLGRDHPELLARALKMEQAAIASGNLVSRAGLGGRLNWTQYVAAKAGLEPEDAPCGCYDGSED